MNPRKRTSRVYWRGTRAYGDFRDYADVGGGQEALIAADESFATTDPDVADSLATARVKQLEERRRNKTLLGIEGSATLGEYVAYHLVEKAKAGKVEDNWIARHETRLKRAIAFFEADGPRDLATIRVVDVQAWLADLRKIKRGEKTIENGTLRKHLFALSNLFRRAESENMVPPGFNPVRAMLDKPEEPESDAEWLEVYEAALFLEAARQYTPHKSSHDALPADRAHALIATFLLTGGREKEVYGLDLARDISFDRKTVRIRKNERRRIKNRGSNRTLTMWPQLEEILRAYVFASPPMELLFPPARPSKTGLITDIRKTLDAIAGTCGWKPGEIRTKIFRHTYCAARLQTLDGGKPVSIYTVGMELGHGGIDLVNRVYGHLGEVRHRSKVVEYRYDDWRERVQDRLKVKHA